METAGWIVLGAWAWVLCGWFTYRVTLRYRQTWWPGWADEKYRDDVEAARIVSLLGPLGAIAALIVLLAGGYGIAWVPPPGHPDRDRVLGRRPR